MLNVPYPDVASQLDVEEPVDLGDPWSGPKTYAADLYTGGDLPQRALEGANAHILEDALEQDGTLFCLYPGAVH